MDLSLARRRDYLAGVTNPDVRFDLEHLLQGQDELENFLDQPVRTEEIRPPMRAFAPGDVVCERFEISALLGTGGMGEVYRAFDRHINREVALKTLRPDISSEQRLVSQLRKEAQIALRITHVNICRLYDFGRAIGADGRLIVFLTMELLEGRTLADTVREKPFSEERSRLVLNQLMAGLEAAHMAGVLHRDFKSGNVMLVPQSSGPDRVVITDFGLAREAGRSIRETISVIADAAGAGTPAYMAPEQLEGKLLTSAADIYALGVVMFEMVTGRLPFQGGTPLVVALRKLRQDAPGVRTAAPEVSKEWESAVAVCLDRNPAKRPQDVGAVRALVAGEAKPAARSRRWMVISGAGAAGAALTIPLIRIGREHSVNPEARRHFELGQEFAKRRTKEDLEKAVIEYESAAKIEQKYADAWTGLADAYSVMANFNFMAPRAALDKARQSATQAVNLDPSSGKAQGVLGYVISIDLKRWRQAEPYFQKAVKLNPQEPMVRVWYGSWLGKLGLHKQALEQLDAGLGYSPAFFNLLHQKCAEYLRAKRFTELLVLAREFVRLHPYQASSHNMLARALEWTRQFDEALQACVAVEKYGLTTVSKCTRGCVEAARGNLSLAGDLANQVKAYWKDNPFETILVAQVLSRLRTPAEVLDVLRLGYKRDDSSVIGAATTPYLENMRREAGFTDFFRLLGFNA